MKIDLFYCARVAALSAVLVGMVVGLTGCAGFNASWKVVLTYNTPHETPGPSVPSEKPAEAAK